MQTAGKKRRGKYFWVNNGKDNILLKTGDKIPLYYEKGKLPTFRGMKHSNKSKEKIRKAVSNIVCYNNGIKNLKLKVGEAPPAGYKAGMLQNHGRKFWINNGVKMKKHNIEQPIPKGWARGRKVKNNAIR